MIGPRTHRVVWWGLVLMTVVSLALSLAAGRGFKKEDVVIIAFLGYAVVGAVIARQRPQAGIGWVFLLIGLMTGMAGLSDAGVQASLAAGAPVAWWGVLAAWYSSWFWYPLIMLATTFTFLLFPNGLPSPRWRPVFWAAVVSTATATVYAALSPTLELDDRPRNETVLEVPNPISPDFLAGSAGSQDEGGWLLAAIWIALACGVAAVASTVWRTWRASGTERLQMRLFAFSIVVVILVIVVRTFPAFSDSLLGNATFTLALTGIPVACGVAILRYRLYDIDRIIGRTTTYAIVTGLLIGVYAFVVTSVTRLLPGTSTLAVAAATLAAAAVFRPALSRVQAFVDRRFNRSRYDAQRTVEAFAGRLRDEVTPDAVTADLLAVLQTTVQPSGAALWLKAGAP